MVGTSVWSSRRFRRLPDDECRFAYIYVLTSPHCTSIGAYRLPPEYLAADMRVEIAEATRRLREIRDVGLISYDEAEQVVALGNWFEFNPITNRRHLGGALTAFRELPTASHVSTLTLANIAKSTVQTVSKWSNEKREATSDALQMVAEAMHGHRIAIGAPAWEAGLRALPGDTLEMLREMLPIELPEPEDVE